MTNDALIKEARECIREDYPRQTWSLCLLGRLADALTAANAREAQANAERDRAEHDPLNICLDCGEVNRCHTIETETPSGTEYDLECNECGGTEFTDSISTAMQEVVLARDEARAKLAALRKEAAEAIWQAYKEGCNDGVFNETDNTSKPGRFFCDSRARRAAKRIGGAE